VKNILVHAQKSPFLSRDPDIRVLRFVVLNNHNLILGDTAAHTQLGVVGYKGGIELLKKGDFERTIGWWLETLERCLVGLGTVHQDGTIQRWSSDEFELNTPKLVRPRILTELRSALTSWNKAT
jgi:hypothetical protein